MFFNTAVTIAVSCKSREDFSKLLFPRRRCQMLKVAATAATVATIETDFAAIESGQGQVLMMGLD